MKIDKKLDLVLEKELPISAKLVWKAWTTPELMPKWFCPEPWKTTEVKMDLRPGGIFFSNMQSPEGQNFPNTGCILEVIPEKKLVWTSVMSENFRPNEIGEHDLPMTAEIYLEEINGKTKYIAIARHRSEADRMRHEEMGFTVGWGIVADQLVAVMKKL